jgi:pyrroline-5-carboxylate reductase
MASKKVGEKTVGFIGGGNMAEALIRGLIAAGSQPSAIAVAEPVAARRRLLARKYKVAVSADNGEV